MRSVTQRVLTCVGVLLVAMGIVVLVVPERYWRTAADTAFLGTVPKVLWGAVQLVVGAFLLYAVYASPRLIRPAAYTAALDCLVWAVIEVYQAFKGGTWAVAFFLLWLCLAAVSVAAVPSRRGVSAP
jgi:hypothetical protein